MELILIVMFVLLFVLAGVSCWLAHRLENVQAESDRNFQAGVEWRENADYYKKLFYSAHERVKAAEKERDDLRADMMHVLGLEGDDEQD